LDNKVIDIIDAQL